MGIDKPITVVFYGDHLPGIYNTANADKNNALTLHETKLFHLVEPRFGFPWT